MDINIKQVTGRLFYLSISYQQLLYCKVASFAILYNGKQATICMYNNCHGIVVVLQSFKNVCNVLHYIIKRLV